MRRIACYIFLRWTVCTSMKRVFLLFLIAIPCIANARSELARLSAARYGLESIKTGIEAFASDCGRDPTTAEGFGALLSCPTNIPSSRWRGPYLDRPPIDPWGNSYVYRCPGIHNTNGYDLYSCGADGISKSGGSDPDDINSWDPGSFRGSFSDYLRTNGRTVAIPLLIGGLLLIVGLWAVAPFSRRVRGLIAKNGLMLVLLVGILLLLLFPSIPQIAS